MNNNETREHILDAAIELFWRKSYHGVNMNELSRTAGVNKATVYQYFASKEELAVASVKRAAQRTEDYVYRSTFSETDDPNDRLRRIYDKVFRMHAEMHRAESKCRGCPFVNLGVELATSSEAIRNAVNQAMNSFRGYYAEIIDGAGSTGKASGSSSKEDAISALLANMNGCLVASKLENRPEAVLDGRDRAFMILGT